MNNNEALLMAKELYEFMFFHQKAFDGESYAPIFGIKEILSKHFSIKKIDEEVIDKLELPSHIWIQMYDVTLLDPDGWDRTKFQESFFEEKISRKEFERRLAYSTIEPKKPYDKENPTYRKQ